MIQIHEMWLTFSQSHSFSLQLSNSKSNVVHWICVRALHVVHLPSIWNLLPCNSSVVHKYNVLFKHTDVCGLEKKSHNLMECCNALTDKHIKSCDLCEKDSILDHLNIWHNAESIFKCFSYFLQLWVFDFGMREKWQRINYLKTTGEKKNVFHPIKQLEQLQC